MHSVVAMKVSHRIPRFLLPLVLVCALLAGCAVDDDLPADVAVEDEAALAVDDAELDVAVDSPSEKAMSPMPSALPNPGACGCGESGFGNVCTVAVNLCKPGYHPRCTPWRFNCGACACVAN